MRLHHVQVSCPPGGEDVVRRFYGDLLGLPEVDKPPVLAARGGCWFHGEGVELHVGVEDGFSPARKAHPALAVEPGALAPLAARLVAAGHPVTWDDDFPGHRRIHTADGHHNRVELLEPYARPAGRRLVSRGWVPRWGARAAPRPSGHC